MSPASTRAEPVASGAPTYLAGIPHPLPPGETVLWQGAPSTRLLARHTFHERAIALYFALIIGVWAVDALRADSLGALLPALAGRLALAAVVLCVAGVLARAVSTTTGYTLTDRRLVLRIGMVLPMSINIPFTLIESVDLREFRDGSGQLAVKLVRGHRIAYIALWPHCRSFTFAQPSPVLRGLAAPREVGVLFANALRGASGASVHTAPVPPHAGQASPPVRPLSHRPIPAA